MLVWFRYSNTYICMCTIHTMGTEMHHMKGTIKTITSILGLHLIQCHINSVNQLHVHSTIPWLSQLQLYIHKVQHTFYSKSCSTTCEAMSWGHWFNTYHFIFLHEIMRCHRQLYLFFAQTHMDSIHFNGNLKSLINTWRTDVEIHNFSYIFVLNQYAHVVKICFNPYNSSKLLFTPFPLKAQSKLH